MNGSPVGELMADQAYDRLIAVLRDGRLASGQFVSMPGLVDLIDLPIAATREAVKRANVNGLVEVLPKRGVLVMEASATATRDCMDLRALLDQEGARRLVAAGTDIPLADLRASHEALIAAAEHKMTSDLPARAIRTDLTLHDALATGLVNPLAAEAYRVNRDRIAVIQNSRPFLPDRIVPESPAFKPILKVFPDIADCAASHIPSNISDRVSLFATQGTPSEKLG